MAKPVSLTATAAVSRLLENSDLTFTSVLRKTETLSDGLDITDVGDPNHYGFYGTLTIKWHVELEVRSWGIKDIYPSIESLHLEGHMTAVDKDGDEVPSDTVDFHYPVNRQAALDDENVSIENIVDAVASFSVDSRMQDNYECERRMSICPRADIDFKRRTITVYF